VDVDTECETFVDGAVCGSRGFRIVDRNDRVIEGSKAAGPGGNRPVLGVEDEDGRDDCARDHKLRRRIPNDASWRRGRRGWLDSFAIAAGNDLTGQRDGHLELYFHARAIVKRRTTSVVIVDPKRTARRRKGDTPRTLCSNGFDGNNYVEAIRRLR
jgi:hypothetical protein